jgi:hypothetical protein
MESRSRPLTRWRLNTSGVANGLRKSLDKLPDKAENFQFSGLDVDLLEFCDRPYLGANSIITNGANDFFPCAPFEFVMTYEPDSLAEAVDLNALIVTYLQLHFLEAHWTIKTGQYFKVPGGLMRGYRFCGFYTSRPCYFDEASFENIEGVSFFWLIPIFEEEYDFIEKHGADAFESHLAEQDPNLCRFDRPPVCETSA